MTLYIRKPVIVSAEQFDPSKPTTGVIILDKVAPKHAAHIRDNFFPRYGGIEDATGAIPTNNGFQAVYTGDYIIRSPEGMVHAQPPKIFLQMYSPARLPNDSAAEMEAEIKKIVLAAVDVASNGGI